jgi:hypothetical protein
LFWGGGGRYRCARTGWFLCCIIVAACSISRPRHHLLHVIKALDRKACDVGFLDLIKLLDIVFVKVTLCYLIIETKPQRRVAMQKSIHCMQRIERNQDANNERKHQQFAARTSSIIFSDMSSMCSPSI